MREREYIKIVDLPYTRLRFFLATAEGRPEKFTIQLEYNLQMADSYEDDWFPIARFDHNPHSEKGHDVRDEGLHMDLLDANNSKIDVRRGFASVSIDGAPEYCENYLLKYHEILTEEFEVRHRIDGRYYSP